MTIQTITVGKERLVVLRERDYQALLEKLEDEADVKAARKALAEKGEISWEQVKAELGLSRARE